MQTTRDDVAKNPTLTITRLFEAPRARLWNAFTDPTQLKRWWGPKEFSCPEYKIDLRVGGKYLACMRPKDGGKDIWSTGVLTLVQPPSRLELTDSFADAQGNVVSSEEYGMTMPSNLPIRFLFEEASASLTRMTLRHENLPKALILDCKNGWNSSFDKLAQVLSD